MDISGSYHFDAPPERVWNLLMNPEVIAASIPGCEALDAEGEDRYRVRLAVALSAITGRYDGTVVISDKKPYTSYRLTVEGQGKPGFVKGGAEMRLVADGDGTDVAVSGTVETGGPVARLGQRLVGSVARMMLDRFFSSLQSQL